MISTRDVIELYERAVGDVYGYLVRRCPSPSIAEDLTAETFLAAARAAHSGAELSVPWLIGTARHKLVDHWRREGRQRAALEELYEGATEPIDPGDPVEALHVHEILGRLTPHHRAALTLRYLDGLAVDEVAALLDRSVHATESLLVRAKAAYRSATGDLGPTSDGASARRQPQQPQQPRHTRTDHPEPDSPPTKEAAP
jgi:RNA polymerase sigma-70 factor (ECF subfamily)